MNPTAFEIYSFTTNYNCTCNVYCLLQLHTATIHNNSLATTYCNSLLQLHTATAYCYFNSILQLHTATTTLRRRTVLATYSTCLLLLQLTDFLPLRLYNTVLATYSVPPAAFATNCWYNIQIFVTREPLRGGFWGNCIKNSSPPASIGIRPRWPRDEPYEDILPRLVQSAL